MSHTIDNKAPETKRLTIGSGLSYAPNPLKKLLTEPKKGGPQNIEEQETLFSELRCDLIPSSNSTLLFLLLLGKEHIDKDLLNEHITAIKETISRGISENKETLMKVIPFVMQEKPRFFEGYPDRASATYAISLFEDALNADTGYFAFNALTNLLKNDVGEPALKAKINELYDNAISRYLKEDRDEAIKAVVKTNDESKIEQHILPLIQGNEAAGGKLLLLTQMKGHSFTALREQFGHVTTVPNELGSQIEKSAEAIFILQENAEKLRQQLTETEQLLEKAQDIHSGLVKQIAPDTLMEAFLNTLETPESDKPESDNIAQKTKPQHHAFKPC